MSQVFDPNKKYRVTHRTSGVYFDGVLRIDNENPVTVNGDVAERLSQVKIVYTSVAPDGSATPDPRPRFDFEEVASAPAAPAATTEEVSTEQAPATNSTPAAPSRRAATPPANS